VVSLVKSVLASARLVSQLFFLFFLETWSPYPADCRLTFLHLPREASLPSDAVIRRDPTEGTVIFLRGKNLSEGLEKIVGFRELQSADRFGEIALAFVSAHPALFKLEQPEKELGLKSATRDKMGFKHVRLQQVFEGLPVWGAEMIVHLDKSNHVYLVQGRYIPTPERLSTSPRLTPAAALHVAAKHVGLGTECKGCRSELVVFAKGTPRLAYRVLVTLSLVKGWALMVDAETGAVLEKIPTVTK
jgi:hypothetical protein